MSSLNVVSMDAPSTEIQSFTPDKKTLIITNVRTSASIAAGLEALIEKAIDSGGASDQDLDNFANLSTALREHLELMSLTVAEIAPSN